MTARLVCVTPVPVAAVRPGRETGKPFVSIVRAPFAEAAPAMAEVAGLKDKMTAAEAEEQELAKALEAMLASPEVRCRLDLLKANKDSHRLGSRAA